MLFETLSAPFQLAKAADSTDASYASRPYTQTEPTNDGVWQMGQGGQFSQNTLKVIPFGTGSATNTFKMRLLGWALADQGKTRTWVWTLLAEYTCALSTFAGSAGCVIDASHLVCDTLTLTFGTATEGVSAETVSPTGNVPAHAIISLKGCQKVEFQFNMNSSATAANALFALK